MRIIVQKLRANQIAKNNYKYRLARSTLALIPLLGIHYVVFAFVRDQDIDKSNKESPQVYVKIAFEMVFTSFQVVWNVEVVFMALKKLKLFLGYKKVAFLFRLLKMFKWY